MRHIKGTRGGVAFLRKNYSSNLRSFHATDGGGKWSKHSKRSRPNEPGGAHVWQQTGRSWCADMKFLARAASIAAFVLMLGESACATPAKDTSTPLDQLPVSQAFNPQTPIGADVYPKEQAAFVQGVAAQVQAKGYRITGQRVFVFVGYVPEIGPQWVVLHAELNNHLNDVYHAKEIAKDLSEAEPVASSIWRLPKGQLLAIAQSHPLPDGKALVGYFSLEERAR